MGQVIVSWLWLKKIWEWCKIHWKFLLGISIPIIVSIILRKGNTAKVYKKAIDTKNQQLKALETSHSLEKSEKAKAQEEFVDATHRILEEHSEAMKKLAENEKNTTREIDTPEKATNAIREKLES